MFLDFITLVFLIFLPLGGWIGDFGPEIQILREISSLEPAPKLWQLKSWSENEDFFLFVFFYPFMGLISFNNRLLY